MAALSRSLILWGPSQPRPVATKRTLAVSCSPLCRDNIRRWCQVGSGVQLMTKNIHVHVTTWDLSVKHCWQLQSTRMHGQCRGGRATMNCKGVEDLPQSILPAAGEEGLLRRRQQRRACGEGATISVCKAVL